MTNVNRYFCKSCCMWMLPNLIIDFRNNWSFRGDAGIHLSEVMLISGPVKKHTSRPFPDYHHHSFLRALRSVFNSLPIQTGWASFHFVYIPLKVIMYIIFVLLLCYLCLIFNSCAGETCSLGFPEFTVVNTVDEHQVDYYDSIKLIPKQQWMIQPVSKMYWERAQRLNV